MRAAVRAYLCACVCARVRAYNNFTLVLNAFAAVQDPCSSDPCRHGGMCDVVKNAYSCSCRHSYSGLTCEGLFVKLVCYSMNCIFRIMLRMPYWTQIIYCISTRFEREYF